MKIQQPMANRTKTDKSTICPTVYRVKKIKELHLDIYHMRGDTVDVSIAKIEDKINEIIVVLNNR